MAFGAKDSREALSQMTTDNVPPPLVAAATSSSVALASQVLKRMNQSSSRSFRLPRAAKVYLSALYFG